MNLLRKAILTMSQYDALRRSDFRIISFFQFISTVGAQKGRAHSAVGILILLDSNRFNSPVGSPLCLLF